MEPNHNQHTLKPYPRSRLLMADGGQLGLKKHTIHGLVEFDVTRERIRQIEVKAIRKLKHPSRSKWLREFIEKP